MAQARAEPGLRAAALEELCRAYWRPAYAYARRKGLAPEAAEDAVQDFFVRALEQELFARADPQRGRLRGLLCTALGRHLATRHEREEAKKRGGHLRLVAIDTGVMERELPGAPDDPEAAFDREWALGVIERGLERLRAEHDDPRRAEALLAFFRLGDAPTYADAARRSGLSVAAFKAALFRARRRFRELLQEEVAGTVAGAEDAEAELRALLGAVGA